MENIEVEVKRFNFESATDLPIENLIDFLKRAQEDGATTIFMNPIIERDNDDYISFYASRMRKPTKLELEVQESENLRRAQKRLEYDLDGLKFEISRATNLITNLKERSLAKTEELENLIDSKDKTIISKL